MEAAFGTLMITSPTNVGAGKRRIKKLQKVRDEKIKEEKEKASKKIIQSFVPNVNNKRRELLMALERTSKVQIGQDARVNVKTISGIDKIVFNSLRRSNPKLTLEIVLKIKHTDAFNKRFNKVTKRIVKHNIKIKK